MLLVVVAVSGCTICPDPFDYSGPVPNGSAPQNDFRARSNGIAPTGGVPRPWPPVVQAAPDANEQGAPVVVANATDPAEVAPAAEAADGVGDANVRPTAAEATADASAGTSTTDAVAEPAIESLLPPAPPRTEILPPLRETPGWRPRT